MKRESHLGPSILFTVVSSAATLLPVYTYAENLTQQNASALTQDDVFIFDPVFFSLGMTKKVDLRRFEKGAAAVPGDYDAQIYINGLSMGTDRITFKDVAQNNTVLCMMPRTIRRINLKLERLPHDLARLLKQHKDDCLEVKKILPDLTIDYDSGMQRLDLTIPQAYLQNVHNGYVSKEYWDEGISALMLGYQGNYYSMSSHGNRSNSAFLDLNTGLNLGAWQLRHNGNYNWLQNTGGEYNRLNTYVQRDIPMIGGRFIAGEYNTSGILFDTLSYRGVELRDVERMLPQSQRGFAPEIRGIARTNAKVTVRQNGQIIRETTVVPGPFDLDDLYPNGYGGDLDVMVTEADGAIQQFSVPYASVAQLLRPGSHHYSVVAGEYNDAWSRHRPFYQATYQRGLNNILTGYGGVQGSNDDYYSLLLGAGVNTRLGALALDVSQARTHLHAPKSNVSSFSGQSYRLSFSKYVPATSSNLSIAAYRYSTSGYLDFRTAMRLMDAVEDGRDTQYIFRAKNRFSATLNQGLRDGFGQLYVTGYTQDYWNRHTGSDLQYQLGYSNYIGSVAFGLNVGRSRNGEGQTETTFLFNLSMPLGSAGMTDAPMLTAALSRNAGGTNGQQLGVSGTTGKEHQLSYGATAMHYDHGQGSSGSLNGQYRSPYSNLSASVSKGKHYNSVSAGAGGTLLAWSDGVVLTPYTSDTFAVVEADGASGATVGNYTGVRIDSFGHAAVPYLNGYEMNEIFLDPKGTSRNVELVSTSQRVAPYEGAVVKLRFTTRLGYPLMLRLKNDIGSVPFGAEVRDEQGNSVGVVGQGSEIYARVKKEHGVLHVKWGEEASARCHVRYAISEVKLRKETLNVQNAFCSFTDKG